METVRMNRLDRSRVVAALVLAAWACPAWARPTHVPLDGERVIGGVAVACTGIGQTKNDPKWLAYPVRVEFADPTRAYLAGENLTLFGPDGAAILEVSCEGPWVLLKLPPGRPYKVSAVAAGEGPTPQSAIVKAPAHGQARFVLTFPKVE
jgi:hypothetical protein